jgi:hypothetical protein
MPELDKLKWIKENEEGLSPEGVSMLKPLLNLKKPFIDGNSKFKKLFKKNIIRVVKNFYKNRFNKLPMAW